MTKENLTLTLSIIALVVAILVAFERYTHEQI
jgi:hypothetical protein